MESLDEKWKIHQVVQQAIESAHANPSPLTIKMFQDQNEKLDTLSKDIRTILITMEGLKVNTESFAKSLTETQKKLSEVEEKVEVGKDNYAKDKAWFRGVAWVLGALLVVVPTVVTISFGWYMENRDNDIEKKIQSGIQSALSDFDIIVK